MSDPAKIYRKHQSFVGLRHRRKLPDPAGRIERLSRELSAKPSRGYFEDMVLKACGELLGELRDCGGHPPMELHTNVVEELSLLEDSELARYLFYRYRYETYPERKILDDFPPCLQVEPASVCNYRCVFCYQTDKEFTAKKNGHMGMMSLDLFRRVIDQAQGRCEAVTLASRGEPLACPEIEGMLAYTRGKFLALKLNTNAWYLDEKKCHAILQSGASTLVFSADAAEEPSYGRLRVGGKLDRVLDNIRRFRDIRLKQYPRSRLITRVSGVKFPGASTLEAMEALWGELVDQVAFVDYNPWENTYERPVNDVRAPCSDLWRRMFVWWDGRVNPCDVDFKSLLAVGRAGEADLGGLWRGRDYESLRRRHIEQRRSACSPCDRCTVI